MDPVYARHHTATHEHVRMYVCVVMCGYEAFDNDIDSSRQHVDEVDTVSSYERDDGHQ